MSHEFHPEAEFELLEAAARYESEVPGLGERFGDEVERVVALLLENPNLGARSWMTFDTSCFADFHSRSFTP